MSRSFVAFAALAVTAAAQPVDAQQTVRASQRGTVSQTVAATVFTVTYDRPVARGRALFGEGEGFLVKFGREWTPGANRATILETTGDVVVEGQLLRAGKYSVWAIPGADQWTVIFSDAWDTFHIPYPEGRDVLRVHVPVVQASHMETLAWYFPVVSATGTTLRVHWGGTAAEVRIELKGEGEGEFEG